MSEKKYKCIYCDKEYDTRQKQQMCTSSHDLVYVPLSKSDLSRLLQFIMTKEDKLLTESLTKVLFRYARKG